MTPFQSLMPMSLLEGFPPIAASHAHTLILGSMPGSASLAARRYYAHPRNAFWPIIGEVLGIDPALPYTQRTALLAAQGYALWDVLGACRRAGSLDTRIERASMQANAFLPFLMEHPAITRIFFNGAAAEQMFQRQVAPQLAFALVPRQLPSMHRLPSTSPANASISIARKLAAWREIAR